MIIALRDIEIVPEHAWTEPRAQAWWFTNKPLEKRSQPSKPGVGKTIRAV